MSRPSIFASLAALAVIAVEDDRAIVGAFLNEEVGTEAGAAYMFDLMAEGPDCNENNMTDTCDILEGISNDSDGDGVPDECLPP